MSERVWAEKYRPKTIAECVLPESISSMVTAAISNDDVQHMIFSGPPGTGKTSLCYAIASELDADLLYLNCSLDTSIDSIRSSVVSFSSSVSLSGGNKIVLFDEGEGMSAAAQNAMKGVIESFSNTRFFFTTNSLAKIIPALHSRALIVDFCAQPNEKPKLAAKMFKRTIEILKKENIEFSQPAVAEIVNKFFPDFRKTLNELQRYSSGGKIDTGILIGSTTSYSELLDAIKNKDFKSAKKWVGENADVEMLVLFRDFYDNCHIYFKPESIPQIILILSDYGYKSTFAVDQSITLTAALIEIMLLDGIKDNG
jgi:DNA polymerase III delta prime subunit